MIKEEENLIPKISICIPAYKQPESLEYLFRSILEQSIQPFEIIVTDDSDDESVKNLCESSELPIKYYKNTPALGSPENWNFAISKATGNWVKLIHHDDYFTHKKALETLTNAALKHPDVDYFYSGTTIQKGFNGRTFIYGVNMDHINNLNRIPAYLFSINLIGAPSTGFFRNGINLTYDKSLIWLVDIEFYIRLIKNYKVKYIEDPLITTVISESQLSASLKNNREYEIKEFMYCYVKLYNYLDDLNKKIIRSRLIDVIRLYDVKSESDIHSVGYKSAIPFYIKLVLFIMQINKRLAFSIFYRLNKFNLKSIW